MTDAAQALIVATISRLSALAELAGIHEAAPLQATFPFIVVEAGSEVDWSHKSGCGREIRLTLLVRDQGESGKRLRRVTDAAEQAITSGQLQPAGWTIVTAVFLRRRTVRNPRSGWSALLEYRVRLLSATL